MGEAERQLGYSERNHHNYSKVSIWYYFSPRISSDSDRAKVAIHTRRYIKYVHVLWGDVCT